MRLAVSCLFAVFLGAASGCGVTVPGEDIGGSYGAQPVKDDDGDSLLTGGDDGDGDLEDNGTDPPPPAEEGQTEGDETDVAEVFPAGSTVVTTSDLNLRKGPSTDTDILRPMAQGASVVVVSGVPDNGFISVTHDGLPGFASYRYLRAADAEAPVTPDPGTPDPGPAVGGWREKAIAIATDGVNLSYWWGHGRLTNGAASQAQYGSCSGSCPNCSHSGTYGADCSGYVAKAWVVPSSNTALDTDTHPYSTSDFNDTTGDGKWSTISKSAAKVGDAMVYRSGGSGHVFLYEKGDAWGQPWAFEARGCSYGIVHNIRSTGAAYKVITKN